MHAARASAGVAYGASLAGAALVTSHPLVLGGVLVAVVGAGVGAGVGSELARAARVAALPLVLLAVLINVLVTRSGLTVFARLGDWGVFGQMDLTVEALVYGLIVGLRLLVVMLACTLAVTTVDPDELLRGVRRISNRSALTATLSTRLLVVLGEDARRVAEAQRCRPDADAHRHRARLSLLRAVVSNSLERSLDVAGALEVRGYGAGGRPPRTKRPWSRHDLAFSATALAIGGVVSAGTVARLVTVSVYPLLHVETGVGTIFLGALLPLLAWAPFLDQRGIEP